MSFCISIPGLFSEPQMPFLTEGIRDVSTWMFYSLLNPAGPKRNVDPPVLLCFQSKSMTPPFTQVRRPEAIHRPLLPLVLHNAIHLQAAGACLQNSSVFHLSLQLSCHCRQ